MRVSREQAACNRTALLDAASRLFRERGIDGVGVAEIAKAAELTHGALYAHFPSKDALVAEAFSHGFEKNLKATARPKAECSFQDHLTALFAASARDDLAGGCPMAASASEIGRQDGEVSARFASAFEQMVTTLEASLGDEEGATPNRQLAVATVAAQIGALVVSRAVAKADKALSDEVLVAAREIISTAATSLQGANPRR